jgi:hypothetical protein
MGESNGEKVREQFGKEGSDKWDAGEAELSTEDPDGEGVALEIFGREASVLLEAALEAVGVFSVAQCAFSEPPGTEAIEDPCEE